MIMARNTASADVDEISAALYASWKERIKRKASASGVDVDEISEALYKSWKEQI